MASERKGYQWTFAFTVKWRRFLRPQLIDKDEDVWQALWRSALAEFFGTLIFVFLGTAAVTSSSRLIANAQAHIASGTASAAFIQSMISSPVSQLILIAFGFGFSLTVVIYAVGEVSGGHVNPAVTWATLLTGRLSVLRFFLYIVFQLAGAMCGAAINKALTNDMQDGLGINVPNQSSSLNPIHESAVRAFGAEIVFTFIFVFVVFATAISPFQQKLAPLAGGGSDYGPGKLTPVAVGLCLLCLHLVGVPLTGLSVNPARSFGPAVALHKHIGWKHHWVFWAGPFIGATVAAIIATALFLGNPKTVKSVLLISRGRDRFERLIIPESKAEYDNKVLPDHRTTLDVIRAN